MALHEVTVMTRIVEAAEWFGNVESDRGSIAVWAGCVFAPLLWAAHLQLEYMLVPWLCTTGKHWVTHLITIVSLLLTAWCTFLCWREWRDVGKGEPSSREGGERGRTRFAGLLGIMSGCLFFLLILGGHVPAFFLSPCWD